MRNENQDERSTPRPRPIAALTDVRPYAPPKREAAIDLDLSANEGAPPPASLLARVLGQGDGQTELLRRYPDAKPLTQQIAARHELASERVLVTAGADDALARAVRAVAEKGREVIVCEPTFEMLPRYIALSGATKVSVPWPRGAFPVGAVLAAVTPRTSCVLVVSPNNPTGAAIERVQLEVLCEAVPQALVVVDLAYGELADVDLTPTALAYDNALVTRTLSKAWGLAGLRVGYALGSAEVIGWLRAAGQPYAVSGPALALAEAALDDPAPAERYAAKVREERAELERRLRGYGAEVEPSQANFVFARFPPSASARGEAASGAARAEWLVDGLAGLGIRVRRFADRPALLDAVRIGCPARGDDGEAVFARLCGAIDAALAPEALLFDMDGVLADVSRSYRAAIVATCESYGVTVDAAQIAAAKAAGDANDDWRLTQRLLAAGGVEAPLEEVTARFEQRYQGGLWREETLLPERALLEMLAARLPLAIVTGRPRGDAERFLEAQQIGGLFRACICREDAAALKPDPAPVRAALEALAVERAWLVGDTPDDLRAARAAGVLPLGVIAPGEDRGPGEAALHAAGAARVLEPGLAELPDLLALLAFSAGGGCRPRRYELDQDAGEESR